jgi:hypothetical protein
MLDTIFGLTPIDIPVVLALLFALSMYPVGVLFPGCPCTRGVCCNCLGDDLPEFLIATISGYSDQLPSEYLVTVTVTSECFPLALAQFNAVAPGEPDEPGPITAVGEFTGSSGFVQDGRRVPTEAETTALTFGDPNAEFTATWRTADPDSCGFDRWELDEVTIDIGGGNVVDQSAIFFSVVPVAPSTFNGTLPVAIAHVGREEPEIPLIVDSSTGTGAVLSVTIQEIQDTNGRPVWEVVSVDVVQGGSGYVDLDPVYNFGPDTALSSFVGEATVVAGAVVSVTIINAGQYVRFTGIVEEVEISDRGSIFIADPDEPPLVATQEQLSYSISQAFPSAGTDAEFEAVIDDDPDSPTFGQLIDAIITEGGDDYVSFVLRNSLCCGEHYNDRVIKLRLESRREGEGGAYSGDTRDPCWISHRFCGVPNSSQQRGALAVRYLSPALVEVVLEGELTGGFAACDRVFYIDNPGPCHELGLTPATAYIPGFASPQIVITRGTDYDGLYLNPEGDAAASPSCHICCKGLDTAPDEVTVVLAPDGENIYPNVPGTYVLEYASDQGPEEALWSYRGPFGSDESIDIFIVPCGTLGDDGWLPLGGLPAQAGSCDDCHKKCFMIFNVSHSGGDWQFILGGFDECGSCFTTAGGAACGPPAGTRVLQAGFFTANDLIGIIQ